MLRPVMAMINDSGEQTRRTAQAGLVAAAICIVLAAGCAHSEKREERVSAPSGIPMPEIPAFLNGPMSVLLTNLPGFRAHLVFETGPALPQNRPLSGELMGRGGKLLFAPEPNPAADKRSHAEDTSFIWDVAASSGYILSGPMQAYAPISSPRHYTNVVAHPAPPSASEKIAGHACHPADVIVMASDGTEASLKAWQALDLKGFPLRILAGTNGSPATLSFSKIRLEAPPDEAFQPPADFTRYSSGEAMINEMAMREQSLRRKHGYEPPPTDQIGLPEARNPGRAYSQ